MYDELRGNLMAQATHFSVHDETSLLLLKAADAIEELSEERDMYIKAMADEHNRAARLAWEHRWIPVTKRLPEERTMVLATVNGVVCVAFYGNYMWEEAETYSIFYPTHWLPLPQPPKDGET